MLDISAVSTLPSTFPKYLTYATKVSGWFFMYMHRKPDLEATGSDMVALGDLLNIQKAPNRCIRCNVSVWI
jgi:hypothetical protein